MKVDTVKTFPALIGVQNTKYIAYILVFLSMMLASQYLTFNYSVSFFLSGIITYIFIYFSENERDDVYFSFGVETCSALPFLFSVIMKYF
ncbi:hypothetical protein [Chryseobacterium nepalense]|uniref:Uncharacterized protein n=2 Tax=Chryseobacterium group TaxID=2782232 RepID=A0ABY4K9C0_9FLAO|nr:hypothetical protein [Chryseobacterium nepalense]UPQ76916.1 hypothetical protein M0D58_05025 [Chryseobacterium nepalense]